jgi:hypothetical protein
MTTTLTFYPRGNADDGKKMLIDYADMRNRLSEAGYAYETKLRALEHQFEVKASDLREEYSRRFLRFTRRGRGMSGDYDCSSSGARYSILEAGTSSVAADSLMS